MIDPVSVGVAFAAVQAVVGNIKSAIGTGKDIYSIIGDIGKFFNLSSDITKANNQIKLELLSKSDSELEAVALQTALMAEQVIQYKKDLKDLLYWSGNAHIWDRMQENHNRLLREKREMEEKIREEKRLRQKQIAEFVFSVVMSLAIAAIVIPILYIFIKIYFRI